MVLNYETSHHTSIDCNPSRVFHGSIPFKTLDLKLGVRPQQTPFLTSQIAQQVLDQAQMIHQDYRPKSMQAYIENKTYYVKTFSASKLKEADCVNVLQPKADHQGGKLRCAEFRWVSISFLKKCYQKTFIWYTQLAPTRRKCFIARECVSSHPDNPYLIYKSHHKNGKPIRK